MNIDNFQISFACAIILILWLKTDAFYEYFKFLDFKIFEEYSKFKEKHPVLLNFPEFLLSKKPTFIVKIATCPVCLSIYLSVLFYPIVRFFNHNCVNIFSSIYLTWILFFAFEKISKR
jgi:hypothetical protein